MSAEREGWRDVLDKPDSHYFCEISPGKNQPVCGSFLVGIYQIRNHRVKNKCSCCRAIVENKPAFEEAKKKTRQQKGGAPLYFGA
jgi:hypothetical protein